MGNYEKELIQSAVEDVDRKFINNKYELSRELNDALKNKYKKVDKNEEKYIELLRFNIIYYKSIIKKLETIIEVWIQNGVISSSQSVEKNIENITNSSRKYVNKAMKGGTQYLNEKDKKIFLSYDKCTGLERVEKIENDYKILNIYKDMLGMVITEIASNYEKYKAILDMGVEEAKIDIMNEIFNLVNEILFSEDPSTSNFEDEALIDSEDTSSINIEDADKCLSFKKYVSMISTPEVSVKINDMYRKSTEAEGIDEEEGYVFTTDFKDYISCVVLLQDYIPQEDKKYFENLFRMYVIGEVSESDFRELCERYIRENIFLDSKTWLECQKNVKSDFNLENNNFFGDRHLEYDNDEDLSITQKMDLLMNLDENTTVREGIEYAKDDAVANRDEEKISGFAEKLKKGISSFSDKLKMNEEFDDDEYEDYEEYYDDEEEDEDEEELDEEFVEDYEEHKKGKFASKLKKLFSKNEDDYEDEDEEDEDYEEDIEIDPAMFAGDESIQDKEALAILKMREKSRIREDELTKKEYSKLMNERQLAEEITKNGSIGFVEDGDIVFDEDDYIYKKEHEKVEKKSSKNKDLFDNTIDGQLNSFSVDQIPEEEEDNDEEIITKEEIEKLNEEEKDEFKPILGHTQRLHADKIKRASDKTTVIDLDKIKERELKKAEIEEFDKKLNDKAEDVVEEINKNIEKTDEEKIEKINRDKVSNVRERKISKEEKTHDKSGENIDDGHIFEELEAMKAMRTDNIKSEPVKKEAKSKVDLSSMGKKKNKDKKVPDRIKAVEDDKEDSKTKAIDFGEKKDAFKKKFENIGKAFSSDDDGEVFSKKKIARDSIIIIAIVVIIFFGYIFIIKQFKVPSVQETNKNVKITQNVKNKSNKATTSDDAVNESTSKVTQKTEEEKAKDEAESKASALDREAEQYKNGKGVYYTVFVGASKDKDGAEAVAYNFARRGVNAKVVRNGGYYMLKVGEYFDYNQAYAESRKISAKGIQNYISAQNKYYDLKIAAFQERLPYLSNEQLKTDYDDLKNQISSTGKNAQYIKNLDEIYASALKER